MLGWTINFHIFRGINSSYPCTYSIHYQLSRALKIFVYGIYETKSNVKWNTFTLLLRRAINSNSRGLNYLHGSFIHSSVNFNNNRKVEVKNAILSPYNSLDLLRRWFNDEVIKESRRICRDIKRASTSRTRWCARSLEELLIEIEKKKENRGREERSERREKEKREKGEKRRQAWRWKGCRLKVSRSLFKK